MNADLTFNSVVFKKAWDTPGKSLRLSTTRGINTPDNLTISSEPYTDTVTKVPGVRYLIRVDRVDLDPLSAAYDSAAYLVIAVPSTENSTDLAVLIATFKAAVADANLITDVLAGQL